MRHMHADLVRTPGLQTQPKTRVHTEMFHNAVVGHRRFAHRMHRHMGTFGRVTTDGFIHRSSRRHMSDRDRFIFAGDLAQLQRLHQRVCAGTVLATTISPVVSLSRRCTMPARGHPQSADNNVATRSVPYRPGYPRRMYHQIAWFVDNQNIVIFINNI